MGDEFYEVRDGYENCYLVQEEGEEEERYCRRSYVSTTLIRSRKCVFLIFGGLFCLLALAGYLAYVAGTPPRGFVGLHTECGELWGHWRNGIYSFMGIPYAAPPIGELRWRPPADLQESGLCWKGIYDATRFRDVCARVLPWGEEGSVVGEEDCLHLSIWTPTLWTGARLPVMVWLQGEYPHMQSGPEESPSPIEDLTAKTKLVYVTLNYRLGAFGFLALGLLRHSSATNSSGNYGIMDQIAALQWVQKNIHLFGGNPEKVTVFGQNSGGASVWILMMSPLSRGLFQRAIDMSGSYVYNSSLEEAEKNNLVFLNNTGCGDLPCLYKLSMAQVLQSVPKEKRHYLAAEDLTDLPVKGQADWPVVVVDGHVLTAHPFETWEKSSGYSDVPFLIGTTEQEADFRPAYENMSLWTWVDYRWFVKDKLKRIGPDVLKEVLDLYPSSAMCPLNDRCPERLYTTMVSDIRASCPSNEIARRAAKALRSPVYRYVITHTPSKEVNISKLLPFPSRFSFRFLDSLAFFGGLEGALGKTSPEDRRFQEVLIKYFTNFAKKGEMPSEWPEYPSSTALLSQDFSAVENLSAAQCRIWEANGFYPYVW